MLEAPVELARIEALEVGALTAIDVDDLDVVAGPDQIAFGRGRPHAKIEDRVGQRVGQVVMTDQAGVGALDQKGDGRRGILRIRCHRQPRRGQDQPAVVPGREFGPRPGGAVAAKDADRSGVLQVDLTPVEALAQAGETGITAGQERLQSLGRGIRSRAQDCRIDPAIGCGHDQFGRLSALVVDQGQPVTRPDLHKRRAGTGNDMPFLPLVA